MNQNIALILSGCGHLDGAEITEAVSLNIELVRAGFSVSFYAPDRDQFDVINHHTQTPIAEGRNILTEAARIARGNIKPLEELEASNYAALVFAGGFGAVKNFTSFLHKGTDATLIPDVQRVLLAALTHNITLVGICAAPLVLALAIKEFGGQDQEISFGGAAQAVDFLPAITTWGAKHIATKIDEAHLDQQYRLITSGAYMYGEANAYEVYQSAAAAIKTLKQFLAER